ncbi:MAG: diaminopimelate epimerase [Gammaproteobacteria bacterium]|nr:diaminopimelate epimerase [Gammaproteobacteria bacterium]MCW8987772.1 diaminopimelate epimerase [Gammaproteobacteria bacterium]MCW9029890.1 diaminopimelate epimerase [Gammaproteobacteria bacterium]
MEIEFTKMHGLGNDFVVIDAINQDIDLSEEEVRLIADRHFGIGCDQLLLVETAESADVDFIYRIFNADGGEVEQCGNGARCFAVFVREKGLTDKDIIRVETASGVIELHVQVDGQITVNMGIPEFDPWNIPFNADTRLNEYSLDVKGEVIQIGAVSMGNPHAVTIVKNVDTAAIDELGAAIENHLLFPNRVNAGFMQIIDDAHIRLRVYERGAGETLACGTGACAAMVIGYVQGYLADKVQVDLPGGSLQISWQGEASPVMMTGPATTVFEGKITL